MKRSYMEKERTYIAIDLKSFYASEECVKRGLDPLNACLVVADETRTNKTICLAVSPALKALGVPGRPRLFEVEKIVNDLNKKRQKANKRPVKKKSIYLDEINSQNDILIDYVVAMPAMQDYVDVSNKVYETYLKYVSKDDIHIYSIDEVFIDVTDYLNTYKLSAHMLALAMIKDVLMTTGITATAGIGTNMFLAKVAMDIVAKHMPADKDGVRIAELDEYSYRKLLWTHRPITDFWRIGKGIAKRLEEYDLYTMGDIARFSLTDDYRLYNEFGINAELIIDHAWGYEPTRISDIKNYHTDNHSLGAGQVLMRPYKYDEALIIAKEMTNSLSLDLKEKGLVTNQIALGIGYDSSNDLSQYKGKTIVDYIGKTVAKPAGGSIKLKEYTSSSSLLRQAIEYIYSSTVDKKLTIRRVNITALHVITLEESKNISYHEQYDLFLDVEEKEKQNKELKKQMEKDDKIQDAMLKIQKRFGKNSIMTGTSYEDGATGKERNEQIGGHRK